MGALSPPWVLFTDKGKPIAILPAGRPGEVANVAHLTRREAQQIVDLVNALHRALVHARLERLECELGDMMREALAAAQKEEERG